MMNLNNKKFYKTYPVGTILISKYQLVTNTTRIVIIQEINRFKDDSDLFDGKILLTDEDEYMVGQELLFSFTHFKLF